MNTNKSGWVVLRGGPKDGNRLDVLGDAPSELIWEHPDATWRTHYVLRGTRETGYYYEYVGERLDPGLTEAEKAAALREREHDA